MGLCLQAVVAKVSLREQDERVVGMINADRPDQSRSDRRDCIRLHLPSDSARRLRWSPPPVQLKGHFIPFPRCSHYYHARI